MAAFALANATINRELMFLRHLFNKCVAWKLADSSPLEGVRLGKEIARCRYLTETEAQKLLDACNDDFRPVVLTALHTGFRRSELASLLG
jgi:integrase